MSLVRSKQLQMAQHDLIACAHPRCAVPCQIIPLFAMDAKKAAAVAETHAAKAFELRDGKKVGPSAAELAATAAAEAAAKAAEEAAAIAAAAAAAAASSSSEYIDEEEEEDEEGSFGSSYEEEEEEEEESEEDSYVRARFAHDALRDRADWVHSFIGCALQAYADATTLTDSDAFRSDFGQTESSSDYSSSYLTGSTATASTAQPKPPPRGAPPGSAGPSRRSSLLDSAAGGSEEYGSGSGSEDEYGSASSDVPSSEAPPARRKLVAPPRAPSHGARRQGQEPEFRRRWKAPQQAASVADSQDLPSEADDTSFSEAPSSPPPPRRRGPPPRAQQRGRRRAPSEYDDE